jgi:hypothetical protein
VLKLFKRKKSEQSTPAVDAAVAERDQMRRAFAAMAVELAQTSDRVEVVLERLRKKVADRQASAPPLRLVKSR